jgi:FtsZ-binding cell division protein ZapB
LFSEYPKIVFGVKDDVDENGEIKIQTIDTTTLNYLLMRSIQELKQENDSLKTEYDERIQTLESQLENVLSRLNAAGI